MSNGTTKRHFVVVTGLLWGHVRPTLGLCIRLLQLYPDLHITYCLSATVGHKAEKELKRYDYQAIQNRLQLVHIHGKLKKGAALIGDREYVESIPGYCEAFAQAYRSVLEGKTIPDVLAGQNVTPFTSNPAVVVTDCSIFPIAAIVRGIHTDLKVVAPFIVNNFPTATGMNAMIWSKEYRDVLKQVPEYATQDEAYNALIADNRTVMTFADHAPFYLYEMDPNTSTSFLFDLWTTNTAQTPHWDMVINIWPKCLGRGLTSLCEGFYGKHLQIGPQLPSLDLKEPAANTEFSVENRDGEVLEFLDLQMKEKGPQSVLYISFGSLQYPPVKHHISILLDVLDALNIPYLMEKGVPPPDVADFLPSRVNQSGSKGMLCDWVPQIAVLSHPATMAFLSHGGSNSAMESLLCGMPMIQWPGCWDQPEVANEFATRGVAYELMQVRNGHNIGKTTARGAHIHGTDDAIQSEMKEVLDKLRGAEGAAMRARAKAFGEEVKRDAEEGGESWNDMKTLGALGL